MTLLVMIIVTKNSMQQMVAIVISWDMTSPM